MNFKLAIVGLCATLSIGGICSAQVGPIGPDTLLNQETNLNTLPNLSNSVTSLQSSYDRSGGNGDCGNFLSSANGVAVMADMTGPGAVVRIWSANPQGTIKIYIDDNPVPVVSMPFAQMFDNSTPPFVNPVAGKSSGGNYCYIPITYAKHCVITTDPSSSLYYQVTYVTYPASKPVRPFALPLTSSDQAALSTAQSAWNALTIPPTLPGLTKTQTIKPGETKQLARFKGSETITHLRMAVPDATDTDLSKLVLRIYFDNHKTADVVAPVADFFGNAYGRKPFRTMMLANAADGSFEVDFPMPFAHNAAITLESGLTHPVHAAVSADLVKTAFDQNAEGYFHAEWNSEITVAGHPHSWLSVIGQQGKFVGIVQTMNGPNGLGFLEGDDQVRVDDQTWIPTPKNPSTVIGPWNGTGTEDCFNSGWYFSGGTTSLPMNGDLVRLDSGQIDCFRWFVNDAPEFQSSIDAQIEHGGVNDAPGVYYSSVAYWYSNGPRVELVPFPNASTLTVPQAPKPFTLPNSIEGEKMSATASGGNADQQFMGSFGKSWSNNAQLFWHGGAVGDTLNLTFNPPAAGTYDLVGYFTQALDYGIVSFQMNGQPIGAAFDGYNNGVIASGPVDLGTVTLPAGPSIFKVTITGKNTSASNTYFGFDALCLNQPGTPPAPLPK